MLCINLPIYGFFSLEIFPRLPIRNKIFKYSYCMFMISNNVGRRVARIWKRGGYFERVRKVQTTLIRIFIVLESVSHGLSENWDENSRKAQKFEGFFRPKSGGLRKKKKKKKVFTEIETDFSAEIGNSNVFSARIQVVSKKKKEKGLHRNWDLFFGQIRKFKRLRRGCFQFFTKNRPQKHPKRAILHTSQANGGARAPLPWLRYWM